MGIGLLLIEVKLLREGKCVGFTHRKTCHPRYEITYIRSSVKIFVITRVDAFFFFISKNEGDFN